MSSQKYQTQGSIAVIDFGGQYAHLIASKIRRLGAYSEIFLPENFFEYFRPDVHKGIILSGGPESVYDDHSPKIDNKIFELNIPILGICYGHQYMMHNLGGVVQRAQYKEYGKAELKQVSKETKILKNVSENSLVWMSHSDEVIKIPEGFHLTASTTNCRFAVVEDLVRNRFGVQFHPEVSHTIEGKQILKNFIQICGLEGTWDLKLYLEHLIEYLKEFINDKNVFFFVSGGVDSTVAFSILYKILDKHKIHGVMIDTGFLRKNETKKVLQNLKTLGIEIKIENYEALFLERLKEVVDPEIKRKIIGDLFIEIQNQILQKLNIENEPWLLGQGTIYPDTIESGMTKHSHKIKTHHNRVPIIQELIKQNKVIEPLKELYKDEVREIGLMLNLPKELVFKQPFPGPGLAVRCLCNDTYHGQIENITKELDNSIQIQLNELKAEVFLLPIKSVGVQGDQRSYRQPAFLWIHDEDFFRKNFRWQILLDLTTNIINTEGRCNRLLLYIPDFDNKHTYDFILAKKKFLTKDRIDLLRELDELVNDFVQKRNLLFEIWQFPVVLIPIENQEKKESVVLRPVVSLDAMTASVYEMKPDIFLELSERIYKTKLVSHVFYDLTSKPPGTIEWE
ncbi:MAG: glutamine-hydrolyzing GMP synthase [Leptospiraceae bacterium]|nr:glutamine-hydrolyzing GMP synthase [Leptospiraceae bacterium]